MRIPRVVHTVWLDGGTPVPPADLYAYTQTVRQYTKGWEHLLWTNNPEALRSVYPTDRVIDVRRWRWNTVAKLLAKFNHPAVYADVIRLVALDRFGGVYVDTDVELLRPLDTLLDRCTEGFFCASEERGMWKTGTACLGSSPRHPIIREATTRLSATNPDSVSGLQREILPTTGPVFLGSVIRDTDAPFLRVPTYALYPLTYYGKWTAPSVDEVFAIHHWSNTWMRKQKRAEHNTAAVQALRAHGVPSIRVNLVCRRVDGPTTCGVVLT